jgi:hypothetical protein
MSGPVVGQEHVGDLVDEPEPPVAAGFVRVLLRGQASRDRGPRVERAWLGDAAGRQGRPGTSQGLRGRLVRLRAGLEARDGPLEQQLVAHRVLDRET